MSEFLTKEVLLAGRDALKENFARLKAARQSPPALDGELQFLVNQAALKSAFFPEDLAILAGRKPESSTISRLLDLCVPVRNATGQSAWQLTDSSRKAALKDLMGRGLDVEISQLKASDSVDERMLGNMLGGSSKPLEQLDMEELAAIAKLNHLLRGITEVYDSTSLAIAIERKGFLAGFDRLIGKQFVGRSSELEMIDYYIEHGYKEDSVEKAYRPLLIRGPGGMGKSTLLGYYLRENVCRTPTPRFPFAYLDFDRRTLSVEYPATLLNDVLRQLSFFFPDHRESLLALRDSWRERLQIDFHDESMQKTRGLESIGFSQPRRSSEFIYDFVSHIDKTEILESDPLVLILDTFEEVQGRSRDYIAELGQFLEQLQGELGTTSELRVILSGRIEVDPAHFVTHEHVLEELDDSSSEDFLQNLGVDTSLTPRIVRQIRGVPLTLRLASSLILRSQDRLLQKGELSSLDPIWYELEEEQLQALIYRRYLDQIDDHDVRKLAHPGLVLRVVTPDIIRDVLAKPCSIKLASDESSETPGGDDSDDRRSVDDLFREMSHEVSIVSPEVDGVLKHRAEVRKVMLALITKDQPAKVNEIHRNAVKYYENLGDSVDVKQRAEEIYHRLQLKQSAAMIDDRWMPGVEMELSDCVDELPDESKVILAARLQGNADSVLESLSPSQSQHVDQVGWESYAIRKAETSIKFNTPLEALDVLAERSERLPGSKLFPLEATLLKHVRRWEGMRDAALRGLKSAASVGDRDMAIELVGLLFQSYRLPGEFDDAESVMASARQMIAESDDAESLGFHLQVDLFELQLAELSEPESAQVSHDDERRVAALGRLEALLALRPTAKFANVCWDAAGELGLEFTSVVEQVLKQFGINRDGLNEPRIKALTKAICRWDAIVSARAEQPAGLMAETNGLLFDPETQWQDLDGSTTYKLILALFSTPEELERFLLKHLEESLFRDITSRHSDIRKIAVDVAMHLKKRGRLGRFVQACRLAFPDDSLIRDLQRDFERDKQSYQAAWESMVRRLAGGERVGIQGIVRNSIKRFGLPHEAAPAFAAFFALPDESAAFAPAYTSMIESLNDESLDLLGQRILGIDLVDRKEKARTLLREAYSSGRFQTLIEAVRQEKDVKLASDTRQLSPEERARHIEMRDGEGWRFLLKALIDAFPSLTDLRQLISILGINPTDLSDVHHESIQQVMRQYNNEWRINELVNMAVAVRPQSGFLRAFALERGIALKDRPTQRVLHTGSESLDRMLDDRRGFINPADFVKRINSVANAVCVVCVDGVAEGTGFLISPDVVLTCSHVLKDVLEESGKKAAGRIDITFGYTTFVDEADLEAKFKLVAGEWMIDSSELDHMDLSLGSRKENLATPRDPDRLDYALLRVTGAPGNATVGEGKTKRGFLPIPESGPLYREAFHAEAGVVIFHHPFGDAPERTSPLRVDWRVPADFGLNEGQSRVLYDTNTLPGSSGAPCLNQKLELIAVHQVGAEGYKQGIPVDKIRKLLQHRGKWDEIYG